MKVRKIILFILIIPMIICILPIQSIATSSIFDVVACSDTTRINPGDNLTIYVYFVGVGNTTDNFILIYFNSDITVKEATFMGEQSKEGLADKGTNVQLYRWNVTMPENIEDINPNYPIHPFWGRDEKSAPFTITISTSSDTPSGEHDLKVIYLYKDDNGLWNEATDILTFHVQTPVERIEYDVMLNDQQISRLQTIMTAFGVYLAVIGTIFTIINFWIKIRKSKNNTQKSNKKVG